MLSLVMHLCSLNFLQPSFDTFAAITDRSGLRGYFFGWPSNTSISVIAFLDADQAV